MKTFVIAATVAVMSTCYLSGCAVTSKQSTVGQYVDDTAITAKVKAKFAEDAQVSAMRINVETLNGEVQLAGFAKNAEEKQRAGELAREVSDVRNVRNNIAVRPAGQ